MSNSVDEVKLEDVQDPFKFIKDEIVALIKHIPFLQPIVFVLNKITFVECIVEICAVLATPKHLPLLKLLIEGPLIQFKKKIAITASVYLALENRVCQALLKSDLTVASAYHLVQIVCNYSSSKLEQNVTLVLKNSPNLELFKVLINNTPMFTSQALNIALNTSNDEILEYTLDEKTEEHGFTLDQLFKIGQRRCVERFFDIYDELNAECKLYMLRGVVIADNLEAFKVLLPLNFFPSVTKLLDYALIYNKPQIADYILQKYKQWMDCGPETLTASLFCSTMFEPIQDFYSSLHGNNDIEWYEILKTFHGSYVGIEPSIMEIVLTNVQQTDIAKEWVTDHIVSQASTYETFAVVAKLFPTLKISWETFHGVVPRRNYRFLVRCFKENVLPDNVFTIDEVQEMIEKKEIEPKQYNDQIKLCQPKLLDGILSTIKFKRVALFETENLLQVAVLSELIVEYI